MINNYNLKKKRQALMFILVFKISISENVYKLHLNKFENILYATKLVTIKYYWETISAFIITENIKCVNIIKY